MAGSILPNPTWRRKPEDPVPEPDSLFAYGTLLRPEVWDRVANRSAKFLPAWCDGYAAYQVVGADYPGLVEAEQGERTFGAVALGIDEDVLQRLDGFEGSQYARQVIRVNCADGHDRSCWVYLWKASFRDQLTGARWSPEGAGAEAVRCWEAQSGH